MLLSEPSEYISNELIFAVDINIQDTEAKFGTCNACILVSFINWHTRFARMSTTWCWCQFLMWSLTQNLDLPFSHRLSCSDKTTTNISASCQDKGSVEWSLYPVCVWEGGSQILINGFETLSSPPLLSKLELLFHLQQRWECRLGSWEHFWKLFSQLVITGNNYKFLVSGLRRQLAILDRQFLFHDPWRWWSHEEEMLKSHTLGSDTKHVCPSGFFTSLRWVSALILVLSSPLTIEWNRQRKYW